MSITPFRRGLNTLSGYVKAMGKWILLGLMMGLSGGLIGAAFSHFIRLVTGLRDSNSWLIWLLPFTGLLIVWLYRVFNANGLDTNTVFDGVTSGKPVPVRLLPAIFVSTVITHLFGGSAGKEGAALQLGGSVSSLLGRLLHLKQQDQRILTICGMGAVFAAVFGTPAAAAVFAVEVVTVGYFYSSALFPCVISAVTAWSLSGALGVHPERFTVEYIPSFSVSGLGMTALVAALAGLVSILLCVAMHRTHHLFGRIKNPWIRIVTGGCIIVLLTQLLGTNDYNGAGFHVIETIFHEGTVAPLAFLLKILFTAITIGCGFKGGEIVPTLFIGASFGCTVAILLGFDPAFCAALGMTALFCGVTNCPIASVLLAAELFGGEGIAFYALASFVSFVVSGYFSLYASQRMVFSKISDEMIDVRGQ